MIQTKPQQINIKVGSVVLKGVLYFEPNNFGLVIFAHGAGSSHLSPRNNFVAEELQKRNIGSLLFDLLTPEEDEEYKNRFDIDLLVKRLVKVTNHIVEKINRGNLPVGYFGASTGSAAALRAAIFLGQKKIRTVVSRGGRPDLLGAEIDQIQVPVLLIVGGEDTEVLSLNRLAYGNIGTIKALKVVSGAGHLFEEQGALEEVSRLSGDWFEEYLCPPNELSDADQTNREVPD